MLPSIRALLLDPGSFFESHESQLNGLTALLLAGVLAIAITTVVSVGLWQLSEQMTGKTTIDNPERPPDWVCDGETFSEMETSPSGCDQPTQIQVEVGDLFWEQVQEVLPYLAIGVGIVWLVTGVGLHVLSYLVGGDGSVGDSLAITAVGMIPSLVTTTVGMALLVTVAQGAELGASSPSVLVEQVRDLGRGPSGLVTTGLQVVGVAWQTYVWLGGIAVLHDLQRRQAAVPAGIAGFVALLVTVT
ncbi:Yip1 family protein [Haloarculaceae archaeon H-GB1-1]|nr:Yip1 family protein [Haloarculaceae archaeon H-GB1-1]